MRHLTPFWVNLKGPLEHVPGVTRCDTDDVETSLVLTGTMTDCKDEEDEIQVVIDGPSLEQAVRRTDFDAQTVRIMSVRVLRRPGGIVLRISDTGRQSHVESMSFECDRCLVSLLIGEHTVARLASEHHVSERVMYRRLKELYCSLEVSGRCELRQGGTRFVALARPHPSCQCCRHEGLEPDL